MGKEHVEMMAAHDLTNMIAMMSVGQGDGYMKDRLQEVLDGIALQVVDQKVLPVFAALRAETKAALPTKDADRYVAATKKAQIDLEVALEGVVDKARVPKLAKNILTLQKDVMLEELHREPAAATEQAR